MLEVTLKRQNHAPAVVDRPAACGQVALWLGLLLAVLATSAAAAQEFPKSSVGMPARVDQLVLAGSQLEARPIEDRGVPVVLRVVATYPHGTAFRYDLEYYGLAPGRYDLRDYLQRKDGSPTTDLAEMPIEIVSLLPAGQILPNELQARSRPRLGGYRILLFVAAVAWILGLAAILLVRRRARHSRRQAPPREVSLAERLRPLVATAVEGGLSPAQRAEIERLLLTYWRRRLKLEAAEPLAAIATLRAHEQAGALLRQIESWLHKPEGAGEVDIAAILEPYRDLPGDESGSGVVLTEPDTDLQAAPGGGPS